MRIFTWGSNFGGQLCAGFRSTDDVITPIEVKPFGKRMPGNLTFVAGGRDQTYFVFDNGQVYGCGLNNCGQLGELPFFVPVPTLLEKISEYQVEKISARNETAFAITKNGLCIGWGSNADGQLGIPPFQKVCSFKPVVLCKHAKHVSAGGSHVAIIKKKNSQLVTCGSNKYGETGRDYSTDYSPQPVDLPPVTTAACGDFHTLAVTKSGHLFGWGNNSYGQIGIRPKYSECWAYPQLIETGFSKITKEAILKCGKNHSILYGKKAQLLIWGRNNYGQISAIPHYPEYDWKPAMLRDFCHVHEVEAGGNHTVLLHENRNVHFWGWTEGKCTAKLDHKHSDTYVIKALENEKEGGGPLKGLLIGAGEKHSIVVVE